MVNVGLLFCDDSFMRWFSMMEVNAWSSRVGCVALRYISCNAVSRSEVAAEASRRSFMLSIDTSTRTSFPAVMRRRSVAVWPPYAPAASTSLTRWYSGARAGLYPAEKPPGEYPAITTWSGL